jgi:hypothetical protein
MPDDLIEWFDAGDLGELEPHPAVSALVVQPDPARGADGAQLLQRLSGDGDVEPPTVDERDA